MPSPTVDTTATSTPTATGTAASGGATIEAPDGWHVVQAQEGGFAVAFPESWTDARELQDEQAIEDALDQVGEEMEEGQAKDILTSMDAAQVPLLVFDLDNMTAAGATNFTGVAAGSNQGMDAQQLAQEIEAGTPLFGETPVAAPEIATIGSREVVIYDYELETAGLAQRGRQYYLPADQVIVLTYTAPSDAFDGDLADEIAGTATLLQ